MSKMDQSKVDNSTEKFFDEIKDSTNNKKWYCGYYPTDKIVDKLRFMMNDINEFRHILSKM